MKTVDAVFPPKLEPLFRPMRYKVLKGGRGSAKSWSIARALITACCKKKTRILCTREIQKSIKDSVYRLLKDQIEAMGLGGKFTCLQTEIRGPHGSEIFFAGLADNTKDSLKSFEGCDICWVEEAQTVSNDSWETLIPTIRNPGSEIWVSYNPSEETDPTHQRFAINTPPEAVVITMNWEDNPWFPEELRKEKDYLYKVDPEAAAHVWGGACRRVTDAQILRGRYRVESFEPVPGIWMGPYQGADFGFAKDPSSFIRVWIWEKDLYIEYESWGLEIETDLLPSHWDAVPNAREYVTRCDCSRPETISQLVRLGYKRAIAADKWPGSVKDGIEHLRSYQNIIIHPRCPQTAIEARLWSWKTDKLTGDIMPEPKPGNDHCWDAVRYALMPIIKGHVSDRRDEDDPDDEFFGGGRSHAYGWMR